MQGRGDRLPPVHQRALSALELLSGKWRSVVMFALHQHGPQGFNELLETIPNVSGKVLSDTLEELEADGLVDRTVVSESPLRVEYGLTAISEDLGPVIDALAEWDERHFDRTTATVLIADTDQRLTEMYGGWLSNDYDVSRAHTLEEFEAELEESPDVVVASDGLPGSDLTSMFDPIPDACRTVLLVGDRPVPAILEVPCDDVLVKPIVEETIARTVNEQLQCRGESENRRLRNALTARRAVLESAYSTERLESESAYTDLCSRLEALEAERE